MREDRLGQWVLAFWRRKRWRGRRASRACIEHQVVHKVKDGLAQAHWLLAFGTGGMCEGRGSMPRCVPPGLSHACPVTRPSPSSPAQPSLPDQSIGHRSGRSGASTLHFMSRPPAPLYRAPSVPRRSVIIQPCSQRPALSDPANYSSPCFDLAAFHACSPSTPSSHEPVAPWQAPPTITARTARSASHHAASSSGTPGVV